MLIKKRQKLKGKKVKKKKIFKLVWVGIITFTIAWVEMSENGCLHRRVESDIIAWAVAAYVNNMHEKKTSERKREWIKQSW